MANFNNPYDPDKDIWNEDYITEARNFDPKTANLLDDAPDWDGASETATCVDDSPASDAFLPHHAGQLASTEERVAADSLGAPADELGDSEEMLDRAVDNAVMMGIFGNDANRRRFLKAVGVKSTAAAIASVFPMSAVKALAKEAIGTLEKTKLKVGFVPITCSAPLIAADPLGIYQSNGLDVDVIKTAGWAVARDKCLSGEYDASHLLAPMPLAMTLGTGSTAQPFTVPAMQNTNGQAIVLANKYKSRRDPSQWKGMVFGVPFEYSMHNFLLRYYVAENGIDPDTDIQIRVVPPPEMVANLRAGNVDGYLAPDPFCQRAVYDGVGFIHMLTKEIWYQHPCCAFSASLKFVDQNPNTFLALFKSVMEAIDYCRSYENRVDVSEAIHTKNYLNQPLTVVKQVMTGTYADGLGNVKREPDRIHFAPYPAQEMAIWILSQMKRWGYIKGDVDYNAVAKQVYLSADAEKLIQEDLKKEIEFKHDSYKLMGKTFDPNNADEYAKSFKISRV
ncbi:MAG: CmpA/NrtA family ABC transporter substrate-binding protein [Planctomycetota bacterium]